MRDLVRAVSHVIVPISTTVDVLLQEDKRVNGRGQVGRQGDWVGTGDAGLDEALGGGLRVGTLTEITGERSALDHLVTEVADGLFSAAGKSHFTLSLALAAQIPALTTHPGGAMILTSEREIATDRLVALAQHLLAAHDPENKLNPRDLLDNVLTNLCQDMTALDHALAYKIPFILRSRRRETHSALLGQRPDAEDEDVNANDTDVKPIRLLVIDSITALVRGADQPYASSSTAGLTARSRYLCSVSDKLKTLAVEFDLAVVIVNQVSDVFSRAPSTHIPPSPSTPPTPSPTPLVSQFYADASDPPMLYATQSRWFSGQSETLKKEASLGIVWANAINVRIMLSRTGRRRMLNQKDLSRPKQRRKEEYEPPKDRMQVPLPVVDDVKPTLIRRMHIVFSPFAYPCTLEYVITASGVHSLLDSYRLIDLTEAIKRKQMKTEQATSQESQAVSDQLGQTGHNGQNGHVGRRDEAAKDREDEDEFGGDVFDDLEHLPAEYWEGRFDEFTGPHSEVAQKAVSG